MSSLLPVTGPDIHPMELDVSLTYTCLPGDKKGVVLASKLKRKKGKKNKQKKVSTPSLPAKKKKKRSKKKAARSLIDSLEVATSSDSVLENPQHLDETYQQLKKRVLEKVGNLADITQVNHQISLEEKIKQILKTDCDTFYLVDLSTIILKYKNWVAHLPRIKPHYAMKCNPDPRIVGTVTACGAGLDVASMPEMQRGLDAGVVPDSMIFANPCKMPDHIRFAKQNGVKKMTFDNANELRKIHEIYPEAHLVLRILADDSHSTMRFGSKFGANVNNGEAEELLKVAYGLNLQVIGVSFHVGSGCQSGEAFRNSLNLARKVFDIAESHSHPMTFLDIGGGFLGSDTETVIFADIADSITKCIDQLFPNVTVIGEPGRYFASECVVLVTTVIARRERVHQEEGQHPETYVDYYISDGVYGSFNNMFFDYYKPNPVPMKNGEAPTNWSSPISGSPPTQHHSTLFGPTCDSIDVVCKDVDLPELEIGDHVYFFNMGAYTSAAASSFNGFVPPKSYFIIS